MENVKKVRNVLRSIGLVDGDQYSDEHIQKIYDSVNQLVQHEQVTLTTVTNQLGDEIVDHEIYVSDEGELIFSELNCPSSKTYNLGTCNCINHDEIHEETLDLKNAVNTIAFYV